MDRVHLDKMPNQKWVAKLASPIEFVGLDTLL